MKPSKPKVEMQTAYEWICDDCGRNNFVSCIVAEMSQEDREDQLRVMGLEENSAAREFMGGEFVTYPLEVECPHCKSKFETVAPDNDVKIE